MDEKRLKQIDQLAVSYLLDDGEFSSEEISEWMKQRKIQR